MQPHLFELHAQLEASHWWFQARGEIVDAILDEVVGGRHSVVVDVGCGTGAMTRRLSGRHEAIGFDTSIDAISHAMRLAAPDQRLVRVEATQEMTADLARADVVLLMDVIEHVPDDFLLFSEVVSAMKSGAFLIVTAPADPALWSPHDVVFEHFRRYSRPRLRSIWTGLPLSEVLLAPLNRRLLPPIRIIRHARQRLPSVFGSERSDLAQPPAALNALLRKVFSSEQHRLLNALRAHDPELSGDGLSLLAVLQRGDAASAPRHRPQYIPADTGPPPAGRRP